MSRRAVVAVVLLLTGILAGCASERRGSALALGYADGEAIICMPTPEEGAAYFGEDVITVVSDEPVTVTGIELDDAQALTLTGAVLMDPVDGVIGYGHEADIPTYENIPEAWADRVPAVGETLQPGQEHNLVLLVEPTGETSGSAAATRISYEMGGRAYQQQTNITMLLSSGDCDRDMEEFQEADR